MSKPTTGDFTKTAGWLDWFTGPAKPRFQLPAGAVDAHYCPRCPADQGSLTKPFDARACFAPAAGIRF